MTSPFDVDDANRLKNHGALLLAFWLPFTAIFVIDFVSRFQADVAMPSFGKVERTRAAPNKTVVRETGDLIRMAGLPFVSSHFAAGSVVKVKNNSRGFRDTEEVLSQDPEVIICGASFADHGTSNEAGLTSWVRKDCGVVVQNRTLAGQGPTASVTQYFLDEGIEESKSQVIVWCVIERDLGAKWMRGFAGLNPQMSLKDSRKSLRSHQSKKPVRSYPSRFDGYYKTTSVSRDFFSNYGHLLPPTSFDRGMSTHCRLFRFVGESGQPVAFYRPSLNGHKRLFPKKAAQGIADNMLKLDTLAKSIGKTLLIVLIPDKYTVYGDRVEPIVIDDGLGQLIQNSERLDRISSALKRGGAAVLNLAPVLVESSAAGTADDDLLYYREDTHWNDRGIRVGARAVAREVKRLLKGK